MPLKNYTTSISIEKTICEIEKILSTHGATHIFKMYNNGEVQSVAFKFMINDQEISFKLPMEEDKILQVFRYEYNKGKLPRKFCDINQARRTGWRIIKDWIDSQMALLEINLVKFEEIFLPYMYDEKTDQTLFQKLELTGFNLQLEHKKNDTLPRQ